MGSVNSRLHKIAQRSVQPVCHVCEHEASKAVDASSIAASTDSEWSTTDSDSTTTSRPVRSVSDAWSTGATVDGSTTTDIQSLLGLGSSNESLSISGVGIPSRSTSGSGDGSTLTEVQPFTASGTSSETSSVSSDATMIEHPKATIPIPGPSPDDWTKRLLIASRTHDMLAELHEEYGKIVVFGDGGLMPVSVSIATLELFREYAFKVVEIPELFYFLRPIFAKDTPSLSHTRYDEYAACFTPESLRRNNTWNDTPSEVILVTAQNYVNNPSKPLPLKKIMAEFGQSMMMFFVPDLKLPEESTNAFNVCYNLSDMYDEYFKGKAVPEYIAKQRKVIAKDIQDHIRTKRKELACPIYNQIANSSMDTEEKFVDLMTVMVPVIQMTSLLLTWSLYYLACHPWVQNKAAQEARDHKEIHDMPYLQQVIDETIRCSRLVPFAVRSSRANIKLGDYQVIPAGTPIYHAIGVSHYDDDRWAEGERFDPERFSPQYRKSNFCFLPLGVPAERNFVGFPLVKYQAKTVLANFLRKFEIMLENPGQIAEPEFGVLTSPKSEILVEFKKREEDEKA